MRRGVHEAVMERDGRCVLSFLEPGHECRTWFGTPHPADATDLLTIEHVKAELRMGLRAPDDPAYLVALCGAANGRPPTKEQRALFRDYLRRINEHAHFHPVYGCHECAELWGSVSRVRINNQPDGWRDDGPSAARFHGIAAWGTRGAAVVGGTNRPTPTVLTQHLRTPETKAGKAARIVREAPKACGAIAPRGAKCARRAGHRFQHKSRAAMDREAIHCRARA